MGSAGRRMLALCGRRAGWYGRTAAAGTLGLVACAGLAVPLAGPAAAATAQGGLLARAQNAPAWSIQQTPNRAPENLLNGVSCASATSCTAVGASFGTGSVARSLAESWNGTTWAIHKVPKPTGAAYTFLYDVSCPSTTACFAVGDDSSGVLAVARTPAGWSVQPAPNPVNAYTGALYGVSCPAATACMAVGWYYVASGGALTAFSLAESWNGTSWSIRPTPNPQGSTHTVLRAVSCTSATACTAVGWYEKGGSGNNLPLAESWNGTTWSLRSAPAPAGTTSSALDSVSCTSATACTAVGGGNVTSTSIQPLAEVWNGTAWSIQATAGLGAGSAYFTGIACPSAGVCRAVGVQGALPLAEQRTKGAGGQPAWSVEPVANPPGSSATSLQGVSCTSVTACTAAGYYNNSVTLAERRSG